MSDSFAVIRDWLPPRCDIDGCTATHPESAAHAAVDEAEAEMERLRATVKRAAVVLDCHIDEPQVCSHAELRATAAEFRRLIGDER